MESKQESTCTKTFQNNLSKSSKLLERKQDQGFRDLVIDFDRIKKTEKNDEENRKEEANFKIGKSHENRTF